MAKVYLFDVVDKVNHSAKEAIAGFVAGDEQKMMLMGLKRFTKIDLINTKQLRRDIATFMLEKGKYPFFIWGAELIYQDVTSSDIFRRRQHLFIQS